MADLQRNQVEPLPLGNGRQFTEDERFLQLIQRALSGERQGPASSIARELYGSTFGAMDRALTDLQSGARPSEINPQDVFQMGMPGALGGSVRGTGAVPSPITGGATIEGHIPRNSAMDLMLRAPIREAARPQGRFNNTILGEDTFLNYEPHRFRLRPPQSMMIPEEEVAAARNPNYTTIPRPANTNFIRGNAGDEATAFEDAVITQRERWTPENHPWRVYGPEDNSAPVPRKVDPPREMTDRDFGLVNSLRGTYDLSRFTNREIFDGYLRSRRNRTTVAEELGISPNSPPTAPTKGPSNIRTPVRTVGGTGIETPGASQVGARFPQHREGNYIVSSPSVRIMDDMLRQNPSITNEEIADVVMRQTGVRFRPDIIASRRLEQARAQAQPIQYNVAGPEDNVDDLLRGGGHSPHSDLNVSDPFRREPLSGYETGRYNPVSGMHKSANDAPQRPNFTPVTTADIEDWLQRANIPIRERNIAASTGTTYLRLPNVGQTRIVDNRRRLGPGRHMVSPTIRVPTDRHTGRMSRGTSENPNYVDTGDIPPNDPVTGQPQRIDPTTTGNQAGRSFADPDNLFDYLRWTYSRDPVSGPNSRGGNWLVEPGQQPFHNLPKSTNLPERPAPVSPDQLRLLGQAGIGGLSTAEILRYLQNGP